MQPSRRKLIINAPLAKVFAFVTDPENWTEYVTSLTEVSDVSSPALEPGTTFSWEYRMLGIKLQGTGSFVENAHNKIFALRMEGATRINEHYTFSAVDGATKLVARIEYKMPGKVWRRLPAARWQRSSISAKWKTSWRRSRFFAKRSDVSAGATHAGRGKHSMRVATSSPGNPASSPAQKNKTPRYLVNHTLPWFMPTLKNCNSLAISVLML